MKILLALTLSIISLSAFSLEYKEKVKCNGDVCEKQTSYTGLKERPIRIDEYKDGQCLVQIVNQHPTFYQVLKAEPQHRKITFLKEDSYDTKSYVHVLKRMIIFDKELENTYFKTIPCQETNSFFSQAQIDKCLSSRGSLSKYYCDIR